MTVSLDTIVSLCKRRGFIFQSSEIYGGLAATYDYGPLGAELKRNVKAAWWNSVVHQRDDMEGLDAAILMHPEVWRASGHVESFTDPLVDCKACKKRFRADHMNGYKASYRVTGTFRKPGGAESTEIEIEMGDTVPETARVAAKLAAEGYELALPEKVSLIEAKIACPECGQKALTEPRLFNLMFRTFIGPVQEAGSTVFLRPETAQGIFVNFDNVQQSMRRKLPFGVAQTGKSFRNEVTTKAFIFRTLEFEQMEIEFFVKPGEDEKWYEYWVNARRQWYFDYGIRPENLRVRPHDPTELAHYAKACSDIEYLFPMGWSELEGIANRSDYDLNQHMKFSGKDLTYFDQAENRRYTPFVIEPSAGADRGTMAFLIDSYREEIVNDKPRTVLKLHPSLAPVKIAVLPLLKNRPEVVEIARRLTSDLRRRWVARYDDTAAIGKLYRRQDEIGTPYCVTIDVQSLEDKMATVRDRDSMNQERVPLDRLEAYFAERLDARPGGAPEDPL